MIKIRTATPEDLEQIIDFQMEMAMETENLQLNSETLRKGISAIFDDPYKGRYYFAEMNGQVAGMLMTTFEWSDWRAATVLWIQSVYVRKEFREKGIYKSLYTNIQEIVQNDPNYGGIRLYVDQSNINAIKVYEKSGMNGDHYRLFEWMTSKEDQQRRPK